MTAISKLVERGRWELRNTAALWLTAFEKGLAVAESIAKSNQERLIILDEIFPALYSGFRIAEFNSILQHFPSAILYSDRIYRVDFRTYARLYPALARRVRRFSSRLRLNGAAAYVVFLQNIFQYLDRIEEARLPFAFELYPGGWLLLDDPTSDAKLSRVFGSPFFRKVIVTQNVTRDYLLRKKFCRPDQIEFIFGVVVASDVLGHAADSRLRYELNKETLDICFVAYKNVARGADKGYDRFVEAARIIGSRYSQVGFHVVGPFTEHDVDVSELRGRISFYGPQPPSFFPRFHARMDIILSPNVPSVLGPGAYDGFPTGSCIEAAFCGTAMFVTDELGMNEGRFKEGEEIVIVSREPREIAEVVDQYLAHPERLASLAENGQRAVRRMFSLDSQMSPRLRVLSDLLAGARRPSL